ncbi:hypothetical protein ICW40_09145 [Actinotalea ferrariae]|uniref:hypothetical protein n=1 Tax=Actinotalea ferrariae TaxID=1386098 RepID=UPI001C8C4E5C|nr:hypothetical protein [Actinotalea ferrariae]MBX9244974.1 hypothetical protein [Actinotalea ferrariae]
MEAVAAVADGPGCEAAPGGPLQEPVAALTSLAFVVAALVIVVDARRRAARVPLAYAALVAAVGVGSFVQHGPDPAWSDPAHDLPLLATLTYVAADAAADLTGRRRRWWWWAFPVAALLPVVVLAPRPGDLAQVGVAVVAVGLTVRRAVAQPHLRRRVATALALLAVGASVGTLARAGWPWCDPASPWQGHGAWHVLAAAALAVLAPTVGRGAVRRAGESPATRRAVTDS